MQYPNPKLIDLFPEGFEQGVQRLLAMLRKRLPLGFENAAGELLEFQFELITTVLEQLLLLREMLLPLLQRTQQSGVLHVQLFVGDLQIQQSGIEGFALPAQLSQLAGLLGTERLRSLGLHLPVMTSLFSIAQPPADLGMLVARTDWDAPKHRGLTYLVLPMHQPGVVCLAQRAQ